MLGFLCPHYVFHYCSQTIVQLHLLHTLMHLWIWYFGTILQARDFGEEFLYHLIIIGELFLQQLLCKTCLCIKVNEDVLTQDTNKATADTSYTLEVSEV